MKGRDYESVVYAAHLDELTVALPASEPCAVTAPPAAVAPAEYSQSPMVSLPWLVDAGAGAGGEVRQD